MAILLLFLACKQITYLHCRKISSLVLTTRKFRAFSLFGERGKYIVSGGNDSSVKLWDWSNYLGAGLSDSNNDILHLNITLPRKVSFVIII